MWNIRDVLEMLPDPASPRWNVVNALGAWAAALGTVFTGFVALWLASRDRRIALQLTATIGSERETEMGEEADVLFSVRNAGRRNVTVVAIGFTIGVFPWLPECFGLLHRGGIHVLPNKEERKLRRPLADGEVLEHTASFHPWVFILADSLPRPFFISQWTIRFFALTSVDVVPSVRVSRRLRRRIVRATRRSRD